MTSLRCMVLLHDLERAAHALVDPAEERVRAGLRRSELGVQAVANRRFLRLAGVTTELAAGRLEEGAVADLVGVEVHHVVWITRAAVGHRVRHVLDAGAGRGTA